MRIDSQLQIVVYKAEKVKQPNGAIVNNYVELMKAYVMVTPIQDQVSATVYGQDLHKIKRLTSANHELNKLLKSKMNSSNDNISMYYVEIEEVKYKIRNFNENRLLATIDIEKL